MIKWDNAHQVQGIILIIQYGINICLQLLLLLVFFSFLSTVYAGNSTTALLFPTIIAIVASQLFHDLWYFQPVIATPTPLCIFLHHVSCHSCISFPFYLSLFVTPTLLFFHSLCLFFLFFFSSPMNLEVLIV